MNTGTYEGQRINPEPFYQGSVAHGCFRTLGDSAKAAFAAAENPFDELIGANYSQNVEKIKKGIIVPPRVSRPAMMYALYHAYLLDRVPANYKNLEAATPDVDASRVAIIPCMFHCPHPTKEEVDNWMGKFAALRETLTGMAPGYSFEPYIYYAQKPTDSVMMAVIMHR